VDRDLHNLRKIFLENDLNYPVVGERYYLCNYAMHGLGLRALREKPDQYLRSGAAYDEL
jgi:hypothetical protein